jgi:hypothetical protein
MFLLEKQLCFHLVIWHDIDNIVSIEIDTHVEHTAGKKISKS